MMLMNYLNWESLLYCCLNEKKCDNYKVSDIKNNHYIKDEDKLILITTLKLDAL
jgi:hypothetical protein